LERGKERTGGMEEEVVEEVVVVEEKDYEAVREGER